MKSTPDADEQSLEEEIWGIDVFMEESENEETSSNVDQETSESSPEDEDQVSTNDCGQCNILCKSISRQAQNTKCIDEAVSN